MEVRYTLELEDYVSLNRHLQDKEDQQRGFSFITYVASTAVGCLICAGIAAYKFSTGSSRSGFTWGFGALGLAVMFASVLRNHVVSLKALRQRLRAETEDKVGKERVLQVGPGGATEACGGETWAAPWATVRDITTGRGCAFLFTEQVIWIVPQRCFGGAESLGEFVQTARRYWEQGKRRP